MLKSTHDSFDFKDLERYLQQRLQVEFPEINSLQVNCFLREKTLVILVHLPEVMTLHTKDLLFQLKQILSEEDQISSYPMELYLKVNERQAKLINLEQRSLWLKPLGIGLGLILSLGVLYGLSRPCVLDSCPSLKRAESMAQNAVNSVNLTATPQNIEQAQQELAKSFNLLENIPVWSQYHTQARQLLETYQQYSLHLEDLSKALSHSTKAASLANPPLSPAQWQTVRLEWENAIAFLKKLPSNSPYYFYAQVKLRQYQENSKQIEQQIQANEQASDHLKTAHETAKIALLRQKAAQSLADWQLVENTWQTAIKSLQAIPSGTVAAKEAQNLINIYTTQLVNATARKTIEATATDLYRQAIQQAEQAQKAATIQQWTSAVTAWRNAITSLKQIQINTFQYSLAQPLLSSYTVFLQQAEINLKEATQLQRLRQNLETICKKPQKICDYQISQAQIKVNLTESYVKQVWYTASQAKAQTSVPTQVSLLNHISKLEKSLQTISNEALKRVEVYNPEQNIIAIYEPVR